MDTVSPAIRSRMMASIHSKDTRPELLVRRFLHRAGFRYRLHVGELPGKPDIVLPRYKVVRFAVVFGMGIYALIFQKAIKNIGAARYWVI